MATESISSSISAAQTLGKSTMTTQATPNSKQTAPDATGFSDFLLNSLSNAISTGDVSSAPTPNGAPFQSSKGGADQNRPIAGQSLAQVQELSQFQDAAIPSMEPHLSSMEQFTRPERFASDRDGSAPTIALVQTNALSISRQTTNAIPASVPNSKSNADRSTSDFSVQTSLVANLQSPPANPNPILEKGRNAEAFIFGDRTANSSKRAVKQPEHLVSDHGATIRPIVLSPANDLSSPVQRAIAEPFSIPNSITRVDDSSSDAVSQTQVNENHQSPTGSPKAYKETDPQEAAFILPDSNADTFPPPDLSAATATTAMLPPLAQDAAPALDKLSVQPDVRPESPTVGVKSVSTNQASENPVISVAANASAPYPSPATGLPNVPLHFEPSVSRMTRTNMVQSEAKQTQAPVPTPAVPSSVVPTQKLTTVDSSGSRNVPNPNGNESSNESLNGGSAHKLSGEQTISTLLAPTIPEVSAGAPSSIERLPLPAADHTQSLSLVAMNVETPVRTETLTARSYKVEPLTYTQVASLPDPLLSASAELPNTQTNPVTAIVDDTSRKESGKETAKNPSNHTAVSPAEAKASNSQVSSPKTLTAEPPQVEPVALANAPHAVASTAAVLPDGTLVASGEKTPLRNADSLPKGGNPSAAAEPSNDAAQQQAASIQSTQLTSQIGKADVKIALSGDQFGQVELHAKVTGDQLNASITVEHRETHALLASDLPALRQVLTERQLRVGEITLLHDVASSGGSMADRRQQAMPDETAPRQNDNASGTHKDGSPFPDNLDKRRTGTNPIFDSRGRLSVRA